MGKRVSSWAVIGLWLLAVAAQALVAPPSRAEVPSDEGRFKILLSLSSEQGPPAAAPMLASDGELYGVLLGGAAHTDILYRLSRGGDFSELRRFDQAAEPAASNGLVEGWDGDLYGTSSSGGAHGAGALYRVDPHGAELTVLYSFAPSGCWHPAARMIQASDGNFYGTTSSGGRFQLGCAFRLDSETREVTVLHEFGDPDRADGEQPQAALMQASDGLLYGVTLYGGRHNAGTVFRLDLHGSYKVLHSFRLGSDLWPSFPRSSLVEGPDGQLYGTSGVRGFIYRMDFDGTVKKYFSFIGLPYDAPRGDLAISPDGTLTGAAFGGGNGNGGIYQVRPDGSFHILHAFNLQGTDGRATQGVVAAGKRFIGVSEKGGTWFAGVIYRIAAD